MSKNSAARRRTLARGWRFASAVEFMRVRDRRRLYAVGRFARDRGEYAMWHVECRRPLVQQPRMLAIKFAQPLRRQAWPHRAAGPQKPAPGFAAVPDINVEGEAF